MRSYGEARGVNTLRFYLLVDPHIISIVITNVSKIDILPGLLHDITV